MGSRSIFRWIIKIGIKQLWKQTQFNVPPSPNIHKKQHERASVNPSVRYHNEFHAYIELVLVHGLHFPSLQLLTQLFFDQESRILGHMPWRYWLGFSYSFESLLENTWADQDYTYLCTI